MQGGLYRLPLVTDKHKQLTDCITGFGNQKSGCWSQTEENSRNNESTSFFCGMDEDFCIWFSIGFTLLAYGPALYGPLLLWKVKPYTSQEIATVIARTDTGGCCGFKETSGLSYCWGYTKHSRTRLDILTTPAIGHREVDSDDDMEAMALANTVVPETAISDMCGEAAGERHVPPDPRSAHPASRSNIPLSSHSQSVNLLAEAHNTVSVQSNQLAAVSSTDPTTSISLRRIRTC